jgi:hypothetical protein
MVRDIGRLSSPLAPRSRFAAERNTAGTASPTSRAVLNWFSVSSAAVSVTSSTSDGDLPRLGSAGRVARGVVVRADGEQPGQDQRQPVNSPDHRL